MAALLNRAWTRAGVTLKIPMFETTTIHVLQVRLAAQSFDPHLGPYRDQRLLGSFNRQLVTQAGLIAVTTNNCPQVKPS
jgi:hypothetical protein